MDESAEAMEAPTAAKEDRGLPARASELTCSTNCRDRTWCRNSSRLLASFDPNAFLRAAHSTIKETDQGGEG